MRIGYIGLGDMGKPMASNLAPKGFETTAFDLDASRVDELVATGARAGKSAAEVAAASDVLCLCVPGDEHVDAVLFGREGDGALAALAPGSIIAIHSTVEPATIGRVAAAAAERGCHAIDAAVTGGATAAAAAELTFLVGGPDEIVERARPVFEASAKCVIHAGALGCGAKLKLAVNTLTYIHWAAVSEAYGLAEAAGIDPKHFVEATRSNGQLSDMEMRFIASVGLPQEAVDSDGYQSALKVQTYNAEKDLKHALELAREHAFPMPAAGLVAQRMYEIYRVRR